VPEKKKRFEEDVGNTPKGVSLVFLRTTERGEIQKAGEGRLWKRKEQEE